jgi:hypothetical protein
MLGRTPVPRQHSRLRAHFSGKLASYLRTMAGERAKNIKTGSLKKFNILQCNMQFEKLLFLVKFFAVTKKFLFTKVFKRRGNNPSLEV